LDLFGQVRQLCDAGALGLFEVSAAETGGVAGATGGTDSDYCFIEFAL
jgi:hypothetical protein